MFDMKRVLHVTEAFNGGIVEVLENIVQDCSDQFHYILFSSRNYDPKPFLNSFSFENAELVPWTGNLFKKRINLWRLERKINPHVIHLHSSVAGVIGRLRFSRKTPVIYSPHGFGFQKRDACLFIRFLFWSIELLLQIGTTCNVAFWPIESIHLKYLGSARKTAFCPLLVSVYSDRNSNLVTTDWKSGSLKILGIGRLTAAKDPEFFLETIELMQKKLPVSAKWVGDGDKLMREKLVKSGIDVTGWVPREQVEQEILNSDILLVTSSWDAGPATIFNAIFLGTPVLSRNFPAANLFNLGEGDTSEELVAKFLGYLSANPRTQLVETQRALVKTTLASYTPSDLGQCYERLILQSKFRKE